MRGYRKVRTSSGRVYYIEMDKAEVEKKDWQILMATAPVITLACVFICAIAAGMIKVF